MNDRSYIDHTEIVQVYIWVCDLCGETSGPIYHSTYGDADKTAKAHYDAKHAD